MSNKTKWTSKKKEEFLDVIRQTGNVSLSAERVGLSRSGAYALKEKDEHFSTQWIEAIDDAAEALEYEARRRAIEGVDEPVIYQGKIATDEDGNPITIKRYSDTLLIFLLKGHKPDKYVRFENPKPVEEEESIVITLDIGNKKIVPYIPTEEDKEFCD